MTFNLYSPHDLLELIAKKAKEKRLTLNYTQANLAERSGVSLGALKKFERTGKISLESLLHIALVLDSLSEFLELFNPKPLESYPSLDHILRLKTRKRGRK